MKKKRAGISRVPAAVLAACLLGYIVLSGSGCSLSQAKPISKTAWPDRAPYLYTHSETEKDPFFVDCFSNDPEGADDPGSNKDVGRTTCEISEDKRLVTVHLSNVYPGYESLTTVVLQNDKATDATIEDVQFSGVPDGIIIADNLQGMIIPRSGGQLDGLIGVTVGDIQESSEYSFAVMIVVSGDDEP